MRFTRALLPLLIAGSAAAVEDDGLFLGEDLPFVDVRFGISTVPIPAEYPITVDIFPDYGGGKVYHTDQLDKDRAASFSYTLIGGNLNSVGPIYGLEFTHTSASQQVVARTQNGVTTSTGANPSSLQYRTIGGNLILGVGWKITKHVHLELAGVAGGGAVDLGFTNRQATTQADGGGWYWNAGLRAGAYATWGHFVLGARIESTILELQADNEWLDANTSTTAKASGFAGCLELGYKIQ